jgi:hypothetical protein
VKHDFYTSQDISEHDNWGQLNIVDGGLSVCKVCGGMEGSLTTDCPGEKVAYETDIKVYNGEIDFIASKGWSESISKNSPKYWEAKGEINQ